MRRTRLRIGIVVGVAAVGLGGLSGCAQVFGIKETTSGSGDDDGGPATLELQRVSIGTSVVRNPLDLTGQTASFLTPARVTATQSGSGIWSGAVTGAPPIEFSLPDVPTPYSHIFALGSRSMLGELDAFEDPNPQPAPAGATFDVTVALDKPYAAGESMSIYTVGAWSDYQIPAAQAPVMSSESLSIPSLAYSLFTPIGTLNQITNSDAFLVLKYTGGTLDAAYDATTFNQIAGSNPISGTMAAVTATETAQATIDPASVPQRYSTLTPTLPTIGMSWGMTATPGVTAAETLGPNLASSAVAMTDTMISASYGNPFTERGWQPVLQFTTSATRTYMFETLPITLAAGLFQIQIAAPTMPAFDLDVGVPTSITLNQMTLDTDDAALTVDTTQPVTIAFTTDRTTNTFYEMAITELTTSGVATVIRTTNLLATGLQPTFSVPGDYFMAGHTYVIRAAAFSGSAPSVTTGDLQTRTLPIAVGYADSAAFTIAQ